MSYLDENRAYWERGYNAVNVDHPVFRFYGRILKPDFGLGGNWERLVDFGCGQGAAVSFFQKHVFHARGVDVSETDIAAAKIRFPHIAITRMGAAGKRRCPLTPNHKCPPTARLL